MDSESEKKEKRELFSIGKSLCKIDIKFSNHAEKLWEELRKEKKI